MASRNQRRAEQHKSRKTCPQTPVPEAEIAQPCRHQKQHRRSVGGEIDVHVKGRQRGRDHADQQHQHREPFVGIGPPLDQHEHRQQLDDRARARPAHRQENQHKADQAEIFAHARFGGRRAKPARRPAGKGQKQERPQQIAKGHGMAADQIPHAQQAALRDVLNNGAVPFGKQQGARIVENPVLFDRLPQEHRRQILRFAPDLIGHQQGIAGRGGVVPHLPSHNRGDTGGHRHNHQTNRPRDQLAPLALEQAERQPAADRRGIDSVFIRPRPRQQRQRRHADQPQRQPGIAFDPGHRAKQQRAAQHDWCRRPV